ncbi:MAG: hypothetical protein HY858_09280 [Candidatus Solibacter usitatus]|nr:hypothetical protein [Candidatus Solibacter usitatus]
MSAALIPVSGQSLRVYRNRHGHPLSAATVLPALRTMGMGPRRRNLAFAPIRQAVSAEVLSMMTGGFVLFLLSAVIGIAGRPRKDDPPPPLLASLMRAGLTLPVPAVRSLFSPRSPPAFFLPAK